MAEEDIPTKEVVRGKEVAGEVSMLGEKRKVGS